MKRRVKAMIDGANYRLKEAGIEGEYKWEERILTHDGWLVESFADEKIDDVELYPWLGLYLYKDLASKLGYYMQTYKESDYHDNHS